MAQGAMQDFPWPLALLCAFGGQWLSSLRPGVQPPFGAEPEVVHSLHEGSSELERVLSLQHELLKLCERPQPLPGVGWDLKSLLLALLVGLVVGAASGLYAAARLGAGAAVAIATVHHDSRALRVTLQEATGSRHVGTSPPPSLSSAGSELGESPRRRVGRILPRWRSVLSTFPSARC
jgi:hypothetical protein